MTVTTRRPGLGPTAHEFDVPVDQARPGGHILAGSIGLVRGTT